MNFPRLFIKDKHPLIDFAYYGSKARRAAHPDVLLGGYTECPMFREGDILDANAVLNLVKCVRWNEWASLEKLEKHIEDTVIHVTQEDRDRWDNAQQVLSDWNELDDTSYAYIKNKPDVYTKDDVYTKTIIDLMLATKADINLLSNVAISGDYNDLTNKPTIPTIPTNVSAFVNDAGYLTEHQDISGKLDVISDLDTIRSGAQAGSTALQPSALNDYYNKTQVNNKLSEKQDTINDLATIRTGAGLGATALQPSALNNYYNKDQVDTKLGSKQDTISNLATIEAGAAKGATSLQPSDKGVANGVATLNENGIIPSSQLPSYVDDVLEYESSAEFPVTGESGKIYVDLFTNKTYRWGGSNYVEISQSLALGETSSTAYAGDKGKATTDAFNAHAANTDIHVTAAKQAAWDAKADVSYVEDNYLKNYIDPTGGHDYIEIGGIKWATMNIGANSITDKGLYFQWGDTLGYTASQVGSGTGQKSFGWEDYKYTKSYSGQVQKKYNATDGKTVLDVEDDAATAAWGGNWRMPTTEEYAALCDAVNTTWTNNYQGSGVAGRICTDKTDSSKVLFFPACGYIVNTNINGVYRYGCYWSSSLDSSDVLKAYYFYCPDGYVVEWQNSRYRNNGLPVRGIYVGPESLRILVSGATEAEKTTWNNKSDFSGSYNDLTDKPTIPTVAQSDWNLSDSTAIDYIKNKPTIPVIPTDYVDLTSNQTITGAKTFKGVDRIILQGNNANEKPGFAINTSTGTKAGFLEYRGGDKMMVLGIDNRTLVGNNEFKIGFREYSSYSYNATIPLGIDKNTTFGTGDVVIPIAVNGVKAGNDGNIQITIPATQVNSDWSANSGVAQILNKPTLATVATSGSYNDLSNKPTIPSIWTGTQAEYDAITTKDPDTIYIIKSTS